MSTIPTGLPDGHRPGSVPDRPTYDPFASEFASWGEFPTDSIAQGSASDSFQPIPYPPAPQPPAPPVQTTRPRASAGEPRLIWPARIFFAGSFVFLAAYLFVAYSLAALNGSSVLFDILFGSEAAHWVMLFGLAVVGTVGVLLLDGVPWWKKLVATALIFLTQLVFFLFDSFMMSSALYSSFGIDIDQTVITIFMSIFTFGLPLLAWNLARDRPPWALLVAFGFGVVSSPMVVGTNWLINTALGDGDWGLAFSRIPWALPPLLGLLLMHVLGNIGRARQSGAVPPANTLTTGSNTAEWQGGDAYSTNTTTPLPMTNTLAILSLIFSFVFAIVGVILGHVALNQLARTGQQGRGLAIAGLTVGYISLFIGAIFTIRAIYLFSQLF